MKINVTTTHSDKSTTMNQTFDFQRFLLVLRLEIAEKGRTQLLMAAVLVGVLLLMMIPILFTRENVQFFLNLHTIALFMLVFLGASLYTNQAFNQHNSPHSSITALMVPASRIEKFLSTLLLNLLFIAPFVLLFWGLHYWGVEYANDRLPLGEKKYEAYDSFLLYFTLLMFLIVQGFAFLSSIYFTKTAYIKTAAILLVLVVIGVLANKLIADAMLSEIYFLSAVPFSEWVLSNDNMSVYHRIKPPENVQNLIYLLPVFILVALWYIAYVRLVEKEA